MAERFCPHCMQDVSAESAFCTSCGREVEKRAASHQLPIGTVLRNSKGDAYLFGEVKGDGGFGMTYIAREMNSGRIVAIKEYFPTRCQPQRHGNGRVEVLEQNGEIYRKGMQSFLSEASMLNAVGDVPSIVHVLDYFEANNTAYMVMEYLNGQTLKSMMESQSRVEPGFLFRKILPLMRDLSNIHESGVLHRDIAPDNIMLMPDGTLKLLDFGCARSLEDGKSMTVVLKPGFAPLEQYQTRGQGPYTDLYALSATLYYCITGKVPPAAPERLAATMDEGGGDPLIPPTALGVAISEEQERLLLWGLSLQPTVRPRTMEDLASRLAETLKAPPPPPPPVVPAEPDPAPVVPAEKQPFFKRNEGKILLFAGIGVAALVVLFLILLLFS